MKILSLRLKNLNSLAGEWDIDFTAPQYETDGLFLITGPTGSGKTTILDAICLALYGRTPRQKSFSSNINEMMPQDQRDCMAEVTFEAGGVRYRSMWSHKRTGSKAQSPFTTPQLLLENADTDEPLGKNEDAKKQIVNIIGMNFEQFTRSMLLAQGNFAAFLKSNAKERAEILEQITGTEIYSQISAQVFEVEKDKRNEINFYEKEIADIEILSSETLREYKNIYAENDDKLKELQLKLENQKELVNWKKKIQKLEEEMANILISEKELQAEDKAFKAEREKLILANKATIIEPVWVVLAKLRSENEELKDKLDEKERSLPRLSEAKDKAAYTLKKISKDREDAEKSFNNGRALLTQAQSMDSIINDKKKILESNEEDRKKLNTSLSAYKSKKIENISKLEMQQAEADKLDNYFNQNAIDENIEKELPILKRDNEDIAELEKYIKEKALELEKISRKLPDKEKNIKTLEDEINKLVQSEATLAAERQTLIDEEKKIIGDNKLADLQKSLDKLQMEKEQRLLLKREDILEIRASLKDDSPCPVCGALHHPYADGQIPEIGEIELQIKNLIKNIKAAQDMENKLSEFDKEKNNLIMQKKDKEAEKAEQEGEIRLIKQSLKDIENDINKNNEHLHNKIADCAKILVKFALPAEMKIMTAINDLQVRMENWKNNVSFREKIKNDINDLKIRLSGIETGEKQVQESLMDLDIKYKSLLEEYNEMLQERLRKYGDINIEKVKKQEELTFKLKKAEEEVKKEQAKADENYIKCQTELSGFQERFNKLQKDLENELAKFNEELKRENFVDEEAFLNARLERNERERIREEDKKIEDRKVKLETIKNEKTKELNTERDRHISAENLEELEKKYEQINDKIKEINAETSAIKIKLQINEENIKKAGSKKEELEALKKDYQVYAELNNIIGQQSGNKFRQFAQGLTLEVLVSHANRQLKMMNDRYLLLLDKNKALELNVSDNYKAGEIRSTSNLSGGETFIISLALALGLASLSSKKTQVDSLFLDEGFGTLDEDSLETTIATLENLKHDGKLIGIISHVGLLRDRINTQIELNGTGGRSTIKGPGCSQKKEQLKISTI